MSGVLLLELSVKSETPRWSARGESSVFDPCVRCFMHTHAAILTLIFLLIHLLNSSRTELI